MKDKVNLLWYKASRIGLCEEENAWQFREVILVNKLLVIIPVIMLFYIPIELMINGFMMIPSVLLMTFLFTATLVLHYFRLFKLARYYLYIVSSLFIVFIGASVGEGINNHVMLIPIVLTGIIIFKTTTERISALILSVCFYLLQIKLFSYLTLDLGVTAETKAIFSVVFFIMAMLLTVLIGFYFIGINKEYETIIVSQKEAMELKNKEITDSITYAKRIQTAILPSDKRIHDLLNESFVLYLPKDVVAGDFYWIEKVNDMVLFAAADCTGHGVPGAMMSVVCNNALNRAVREEKLSDPGKILDQTRQIIIEELSKSSDAVKDGMDISLCAFNTSMLELHWAGANNPLWLVRNNELIEVKPDKQPIGQHFDLKEFTTHKLKLLRGDVIYVATDGFQDQFGGEKGKKFKASNLKQHLVLVSQQPMTEQKSKLREVFVNWKGKNEQVDDVCLIGVRV